jgi:uncharacterized protein YyaL (SSP411 family)
MYVAWNAMCISAYLAAGRVLGDEAARAFAIKSLDRILHDACRDGMLAHVIAYGEPGFAAETVAAVLDDYVFLGHAALDAWEATGELKYYNAAKLLAEAIVERFLDCDGSGFFDTSKPGEGERRLGALGARRKPLQDSPTPAGNPMAAMLLMRMTELSGNVDYTRKAQATVETFAGVVEHFGLYAATYALALQRYLQPPVQVCIIGSDTRALELEDAALRGFAVNKSVIRLARIEKGNLPPELDATLPELPQLDGSLAVVCSGGTCQPAVQSAQDLTAALGR